MSDTERHRSYIKEPGVSYVTIIFSVYVLIVTTLSHNSSYSTIVNVFLIISIGIMALYPFSVRSLWLGFFEFDLLLFFLWCIFSLIFITNGSDGPNLVRTIGMLSILAILGSQIIPLKDLRFVENSILIGTAVLSLWSLIVSYNNLVRLGVGGVSANSVAHTFSLCSIILLQRAINEKASKYGFFYIIMVCLVLLTQSRRALIVVSVSSFVLLIKRPDDNGIHRAIKSNRTAVLFMIGMSLLFGIKSGIIGKYTARFNVISEQLTRVDNRTSVSLRMYYIQEGLQAFIQKPFWGHGIGASEDFLGTFFHNNYIQLLFEVGAVGLILYMLPILVCLVRAIKLKNHISIALIAMILVEGVFSITYYKRIFYIILVLSSLYNRVEEKGMDKKVVILW